MKYKYGGLHVITYSKNPHFIFYNNYEPPGEVRNILTFMVFIKFGYRISSVIPLCKSIKHYIWFGNICRLKDVVIPFQNN